MKVEKFDVDLTLDDDEAAGGEELDAALGHVAHYDPGSDQSLSADGQLFGAVTAAGADGTLSGNGEHGRCRYACHLCWLFCRLVSCNIFVLYIH